MGNGKDKTQPAAVNSPSRRAFFRKLMRATYVAPAVTTVMLAALQPGDPSGGMMTFAPPPPPGHPSRPDQPLPKNDPSQG